MEKIFKFKIEIIDNQIDDFFQINLYKWKKVNKWYQFEKIDWGIEFRHILGKKYMCPEIFQKRITIEQYFEREVQIEMERDGIEEVHRIIIAAK